MTTNLRQLGLVTILLVVFSLPSAAAIRVFFANDAFYALSREERDLITELANETDAEVRAILPNLLPETIVLTVTVTTGGIPETGTSGYAASAFNIGFVINPWRPEGVRNIVTQHLRTTLFHELHHVARGFVMESSPLPRTLMEAVISEGLATAFERDFAEAKPLWGEYPDNVDAWVIELMSLPDSAYAQYQSWMLMHPDGRRWIGYRAGTYIVDRAMQATGLSAADLVRTPGDEILKMASIVD